MSTMLLRKIVLLICVGCFSTAALAEDVNWTGGGDPNTPYWGIAANWDLRVPTSGDRATIETANAYVEVPAGESYDTSRFNVAGAGTTAYLKISEGAYLSSLKTADWPHSADVGVAGGGGTDGTLEVDGGTVYCASRLVIGRETGGRGTLIVNSGAVNIAGSLMLSDYDSSYSNLIMNGGTVTSGNLVSWRSRAKVLIDLNAGLLDSGGLDPSLAAIKTTINIGTGEPYGYVDIDIDHGTWIMDGDTTTDIQGFKDAGELVAFGGVGTVEYDYDVTTPNRTTVYGTHPLNPSPEYDEVVQVTDGAVLEWDNYVEPNEVGGTVTATVWFGTDPNKLNPAVYSKVAGWDAQPVTTGTRSATAPIAVADGETYYWQVDFDNGGPSIIEGPVLKFVALDNTQPTVSVQNVSAWLDEGTGEAVVVMEANVDDDTPGITYTWILSPAGDPSVSIDSTSIEDPTLTIDATGVWDATLTVEDGYWTESATAQVTVSANPCEAARAAGIADLDGDVTNDCEVDIADLEIVAQTWLLDTKLTENLYF